MPDGRNIRGIWLLVFYFPISGFVIGLAANLLLLPVPATGSHAFGKVFWVYALRFPSEFSFLRWIAPVLAWFILFLMLVAVRSRKPIISVFAVRVVLLVLIVIVILLTKIFSTILVLASGARDLYSPELKNLVIFLPLFVDVDLILVLATSYLRLFKPLKRRLV